MDSEDRRDAVQRASSSRNHHQLSSTQVVFAVILAIGLILAINFSSRISDERELNRIREAVVQEIALLQREQVELLAQLDYVQGDTYVQDWARREGKMVQEGDLLFVPIPLSAEDAEAGASPALPAASSTAAVETTYPEPENWELWWQLFFDTPPPEL